MPDSDLTHIPSFAELAADPEIAALLDFAPAPRKIDRPNGWTAERQRELIACIAWTGSPRYAAEAMDKDISGTKHLYRAEGGEGFREAWRAAMELHASRERGARAAAPPRPFAVPGIGQPLLRYGGVERDVGGNPRQPGQRLNEHGLWEDESSIKQRDADAGDSIRNKLLRCRRIYLGSIAGDAGSAPRSRS